MCIIAFAHRASSRHPLIVAANRDESHSRPTLRADWWADSPVLGGRDELAGGTWLAMDRRLRLAAVTNVRDSSTVAEEPAESRGLLVSRFVTGSASAAAFAESLSQSARYAPHNLLVFDGRSLHYSGNRSRPHELAPGVHALSNAPPGVPWPKVQRARDGVAALLEDPDPTEALFDLLAEQAGPSGDFDARQVSLFLRHPVWGTRCSTVILADQAGRVRFAERSFDPDGRRVDDVRFDFTADPAALAALRGG